MREKLKEIVGERITVEATIERFGKRNPFVGKEKIQTILLKNVRSVTTGDELTTHLWIDRGKRWAGVTTDCVVRFDARVAAYTKGYRGSGGDPRRPISVDYRLSYPTRIEIVRSRRVAVTVVWFRWCTGSRLAIHREFEFDRVVDPDCWIDWTESGLGDRVDELADVVGWDLDRVEVTSF